MSERARASLRHVALPASILLVMTACLWLFWRQSHATSMPVADRRLHELYSLEPGEVVRLLPPPGIPERARYNVATRFGQLQNPQLMLRWDGRAAQTQAFGLGGHPLDRVVQEIGIDRTACEIEPTLKLRIPGDLIVRHPAPLDEKVAGLETILKSVTGQTIRIERRATEREVIVVTGTFARNPLPSPTLNPSVIHVYADATLDEGSQSGGGAGRVSALLQSVSRLVNRRVIDRTTSPAGTVISWSLYRSSSRAKGDEKALEQLLKNLSAQTTLTFTREKQPSEMYFVREAK